MSFMEKLFGNFSDKELKRIKPIANKVLELEPEMQKLTDEELQAKTPYLKEKLKNGASLDDILPEAFAVCREADWRVLGLKPYPVQIIGGIVLHRSCIAEMQTGEGKTLVATMPVYLNALTGEGVHVVTVNDYLAKRDSEWMGKVYRFLGLTVGLVIHDVQPQDRRKAYLADVTYGTNNEFGFDYLRDNMVVYKASMVQRGHAYAIVDEVDSILIDEARTPLIISGKGEDSSVMYKRADDFAKTLKKSVIVELDDKVEADEQVDGDYVVDEKHKTCTLTESGVKKAEAWFNVENLADADNMTLRHYIDGAIKARGVMHRDTDYIVKDGEVIIVDEFTGRLMYGRRFNDGLHQAIEAKEGVTVAAESKTLASITFQNYFRMYKKLGGMTGTASTEADEFSEIYGLQIVSIPTNKPRARKDLPDSVYKTINGKYNAVIEQVAECHAKGQPVLVGTVSVEKSEALSKLLKKRGIEHIAIEEFPGTMVWSASTLLKLREATDPMLGINLDPSHMMVLGADPIAAARALKGCIFHVHGKDARIERGLADTDGLLEPRPVTESADRVWNYVAVGCGKDLQWWKEFFSVCHMMGYDGDVSLEMEDLIMTVDAGVNTSIDALRQTISQ